MTDPFAHEIAAHASSLRRMARALVASHDVDDLVQDTTLAALRSPPSRTSGLGGWLTTILRRAATSRHRAETRRWRRESAVARGEPTAGVEAELERRETVAQLTAALMALPEPYRDTLLQRFFADLQPAVIAARGNVPVETVKTRLKRGLALMRQRLGADGRDDWRLAFPVAFGFDAAPSASTATTGVLLMTTAVKSILVTAAAVVAIAACWGSVFDWPSAAVDIHRPEVGPPLGVHQTTQVPVAEAAAPDRALVRGSPAPDASTTLLELRFVDAASGVALPGVRLMAASTRRTVPLSQAVLWTADVDGRVRFDVASAARAIAWSPTTVPEALDLATVPESREVRLQRAHDLTVHCVDEDGAPIAGCVVMAGDALIMLPPGPGSVLGFANPALASGVACGRTDAAGVLRLSGIPFAPVFARAFHASMLPDDEHLNECASVAAGEDQIVLHFRRGLAAVAALPMGITARSFDFRRPHGIDRTLYGNGASIKAELERRFAGCGACVWLRRTPPGEPQLQVRAVADDGSLWTRVVTWQPIDRIDAPVLLQPAVEPTGWLRVDLVSGLDWLQHVDLTLVGDDGQYWSITSCQPVQLPCGRYSLDLAQPLPRIDDVVARSGLEVIAGDRAEVQVVRADLGAAFGWIRLGLRPDEDSPGFRAGVSLNLQSGDAFAIVAVPSGKLIMVPGGTHRMTVSQFGYTSWQGTVAVAAGQVIDVDVDLHAAPR